MMSAIWKRWEGQVIDHKYQLRNFLGCTDHSAVFLAEFRGPEPRKAAVKFLSADLPHSEQVLADWAAAQQLSHPNLLSIYSVGRCRVEDMDLVYVAMEYADENLSQILPHRALTHEETREMLSVIVDVLVFLHSKKLTHGHIKPTNIVAIGDQLKLTSDTIQPLVEAREMRRERDTYDAPEIPASPYAPAADIWSLGVTLVEALTQQPAFLPYNEKAEPVISPSLREPFREIAGHALLRNPNSRWSSMDIAVRLNPEAAEKVRAAMTAAAAVSAPPAQAATASSAPASVSAPNAVAASPASSVAVAAPPPPPANTAPPPAPPAAPISPLSVPLSKEPAVPLSKQPSAKAPDVRPPLPPPPVPRPEAKSGSSQSVVLPNYVVPLAVAILILVAVIALPKLLRRGTQSANTVATSSARASAPAAVVAGNSAGAPVAPASNPAAKSTPSQPSAKTNSAPNSRAVAPSPAPAVLHNSESAPVASSRKTTGSPDRGEVLDQILPRPSSSALASVQGTVRVVVQVNVDAAGNVAQAALENPGPSRYFAQKSLEAARGWVFLSPAPEGRSVPSEWQIRFEFTSRGINAYPKQIKP